MGHNRRRTCWVFYPKKKRWTEVTGSSDFVVCENKGSRQASESGRTCVWRRSQATQRQTPTAECWICACTQRGGCRAPRCEGHTQVRMICTWGHVSSIPVFELGDLTYTPLPVQTGTKLSGLTICQQTQQLRNHRPTHLCLKIQICMKQSSFNLSVGVEARYRVLVEENSRKTRFLLNLSSTYLIRNI